MPFGSLSAGEMLRIRLELDGAAEYVSKMRASAAATLQLHRSQRQAAMSAQMLTRRTWAQNQAMFTMRRAAFYATMGVVGLGAAYVRLGFQFMNTMQTAKASLRTVITAPGALTKTLKELQIMAAETPFGINAVTMAFQQMYSAFRPIGIGVKMTTDTVQALMDNLAFGGNLTEGTLKRASLALQDMANMGQLSAITVRQLARNGVQILPALRKEFGLTADQIDRIAESGLTGKDAVRALINYSKTNIGVMGAAFRLSNETMLGSWQQFQDIVGQASAGTSGKSFLGIHSALKKINLELITMMKAGEPITLYKLIDAIDRQLSPSTHLLMNSFQFLKGVVESLGAQLYVVFKTVQLFLTPFNKIFGIANTNEKAFRALGWITGVLITLWAVSKVRLIAMAVWMEVLIVKTLALAAAETTLATVQGIRAIKAAGGLKMWALALQGTGTGMNRFGKTLYRNNNLVAKMTRLSTRLIPVLTAAAAASWSFTASLLANPITWIVIGIIALAAGAVLLYKKWEPFRNLVDGTVDSIRTLIDWISRAVDKANGLTNGKLMKYLLWTNPVTASAMGISKITGRAHGGNINSTRPHLVGEFGPEIASFPVGTRIVPNSQIANVSAGTGVNAINVIFEPIRLYLDKVKIAEAVATVKTDTQARA